MRPASSAFLSALDVSSSGCGYRRKTEIELTLLATGQEGEKASAATGQVFGGSVISEVGHGVALRLSDFKIYCPSPQAILGGVETVDARPYVLGYRHIAQPDAETCLAMAESLCARDLRQKFLPCQEYVSQQEFSGVDVCKLEMGMLPLRCDAESLPGC